MSEPLKPEDGQVHTPNGVYPLNWNSNIKDNLELVSNNRGTVPTESNVYPDFQVWKQTEHDDLIMKNHLQKGYVKPQLVKNEEQSGRQLITELLNRSSTSSSLIPSSNGTSNVAMNQKDLKLDLMGQIFVDALHKRKIFNSVKVKDSYKPPPRVTLTEHKKELWLRKLADPNVPLTELSRSIPHGLRNKILLEQCLNHQIPIYRAVWLIKCVSSNMQRQLKRKSSNNGNNISVNKWIIEWTDQINSFFESIIEQCFISTETTSNNKYSKIKLNYTIELIVNLYAEDLMNRITFLTWIVRYTSNIVHNAHVFTDLKVLSAHQLIIKIFWFKIIKFDYLSKELGESMLLILLKINQFTRSSDNSSNTHKYNTIGLKLSNIFQYLIKYLFYYNSDTFILPSKWNLLKNYLKKVLDMNLTLVSDQFKLISYRNESLIIDEFDRSNITSTNSDIIPNDKFSLILNKLNNAYNETIPSLSKLIFEDTISFSVNFNWRKNLILIFQWCIQSINTEKFNYERITLVCSILQFRINQLALTKSKKLKAFESDLESKVISFIYSMSEILNFQNEKNPKGSFLSVNNFLLLINKLYSMNLFVISPYLRKLIASGVIYLSRPDRTSYIHILILNSLPDLKEANLKSILNRLTDSTNIHLDDYNHSYNIDDLKNFKMNAFDAIFSPITTYNSSFVRFIKFDELCIFNDPIQVCAFVEIGNFTITEFTNRIKQNDILSLDYRKLSSLYEAFDYYYTGKQKFFMLVIDVLDKNEESCNILINDDKTFTLLLSMIFDNSNLLKNTLYNQKTNYWDHIIQILKKWMAVNRYHIINVLKMLEIPHIIYEQIHDNDDDTSINNALKIDNTDNTKIENQLFDNTSPNIYLSGEELSSLDVVSYERLSNAAEFNHHAILAITRYSNVIKGVNNNDMLDISLIVKFLKSLQIWKPDDFSKCICDYLNRFLKPILTLDYESNMNLILKLIINEFISIKNLFDVFQNSSISSDLFEDNSNNNMKLFWDLFFNSSLLNNLPFIERFSYNYAKKVYIYDYPDEYYRLLIKMIKLVFHLKGSANISSTSNNSNVGNTNNQGISSKNDNISNSPDIPINVNPVNVNPSLDSEVNVDVAVDVMNSFHDLSEVPQIETNQEDIINLSEDILNNEVVKAFWKLITNHLHLFIENFYISYKDYNYKNMNRLMDFMFDKMIKMDDNTTDEEKNDTMYNSGKDDKILMIFENLNYFNLSVSQWILTYSIKNKYHNIINNNSSTSFNTLIENILKIVEDDESKYKLFGELFIYLPDDYKNKILSSCESIYFNSEKFPTVITSDGINVTNLLTCFIQSCSRLQFDAKLEMSDALVFSLNLALEKLIAICSNLDNQKKRLANKNSTEINKDLETGITSISKIILLHKYFLVELILKRSVNLQKDVLIINLMKIFNHKIMNKKPKLKNLLYDVLISIKVIISEKITQQYQRSQSVISTSANTPLITMNNANSTSNNGNNLTGITNNVITNGSSTNVGNAALTPNASNFATNNSNYSNNKGTPIPNTFFSPLNSPKLVSTSTVNFKNNNNSTMIANSTSAASGGYIIMPNILNIKPPSYNNNLNSMLDMFSLKDTIPEKNMKLYTVNQEWDGTVNGDEGISKFSYSTFDMIEGLPNDSAVNVQLFGVSVRRENPR